MVAVAAVADARANNLLVSCKQQDSSGNIEDEDEEEKDGNYLENLIFHIYHCQ